MAKQITNDEYAEEYDRRDGDDDYGKVDQRLARAIQTSYRLLRPYRKAVYELTKEYAGPMYGYESGTDNRSGGVNGAKYINLLKQAVSSYMTLLASNRPRALVTCPKPELQLFADHFGVGINSLMESIEIEKVISQWVRDAFFWIGIVKVHMADTGQMVQEGDILMDPGKPFASNIVLDDFFWDTNARKLSECRFAGDIYRLPVDTLKNSGLYEGKALKELQATSKVGGAREEQLRDISLGYEVDDDELEPMADVCDIWLPRDGVVITYIVQSRTELTLAGDAIAEYEWEGKELGPYHILHFDEVSENVLPCSTAADLYPLDKLINNIFTKQARKAKRQKTNPTYTPAGADSAKKLKTVSDGEWVEVQDPREVNVIDSGGINPGLQGFMLNSMELFDRMAGNLQAMMGLGAQTDTVGQEKLVHGAASRREGQLQTSVLGATVKLVTDLAFLLWNDGYTEFPARVAVEGVEGFSYDATWSPEDREGEFNDYQFSIDIYSMQYQGPAERINKINQLLAQVYLPLMPYIQQQGGTIDLAKLSQLHSEMLDLPRFKEIVMFSQPPTDPGQADGARKSPVTNRNYTRRSESGGDGQSPDAADWLSQMNTPQT